MTVSMVDLGSPSYQHKNAVYMCMFGNLGHSPGGGSIFIFHEDCEPNEMV